MFNIHKATIEDIPLIRELTFKVWPQTYAAILSQEQIDYMLEIMYSETSLQQQMDTGCQFIIITDETEPVGFASYQEIKPSVFKLHKIYVLTPQQGKGTGRFLLDYIITEISKAGASALQLQVNKFNTARNFYEKLNFKVIEEADIDIGNGFRMNDYIMERTL